MSDATSVAYYVAYLLLVLTAVSSAQAAWRYRDAHHLNILLVVISNVLVAPGQRCSPISSFASSNTSAMCPHRCA